jgi:hypothetical protein
MTAQNLAGLKLQAAHEYPAQAELTLANLRRLVEQAHAQLVAFLEQRSNLWRPPLP